MGSGEPVEPGPQGIEVSVSDQSQLRALHDWLRAIPAVSVARRSGDPGSGELGTLDYLTVLASSGGLIAAIKILPEFLRSRRAGLSITVKAKGKEVSIDATNVDDVMPILRSVLDA